MSRRGASILFWTVLSAAILASRLAHLHILWADEDYHLAAAIQVLHGKLPYRDFWYDKPPLNLLFYLLFDARIGLALRLADSVYVIFCCALAWLLAAKLWSNREACLAAAALAFFSIFYLAPGIIPEEPDTLMLLPHLAAVYFAACRRPLLSGLAAGLAFQLNVKGALVLVSAGLFSALPALPALLAGFLIPNALVALWLAVTGSFAPYVEQVWKWGLLDASSTPAGSGALVGWFGFHAALLIAAVWCWTRERTTPEAFKTFAWSLVSLAGASIGLRFAPRYFMQLLPALTIPAGRGFLSMPRALQILAAATLLVPAIRFGHISAQDTALDRESYVAAQIVSSHAHPGDTIFVWGYRPGVIAYTRLPVASLFWDSQPLTGVPANRHLSDSHSLADPSWLAAHRRALAASEPTFLVDGLSLYNPGLDIHNYPDLSAWLAHYCPLARTGQTMIYRTCESAGPR